MRFLPILLAFVLTACSAGTTPPVQMRVVDGADGQPVAGAKVTFCGEAWEGTLTGHGGKRQMLFRLEATTDARGAFSLPARPFDSRPFGFSTNFEHALLVVDKARYEPQRLINCCARMGSEESVSKWGYNNTDVRLRRRTAGAGPSPRASVAADCAGSGYGWEVSPAPPAGIRDAVPPAAIRVAPAGAPTEHKAAQPAAAGR